MPDIDVESLTADLAHPILENDYATRWMGVEVLTLEPGLVRIRMRVRQEMLNGFGITHGGMIFAFADTAFALVCNDPLGDGGTGTVATGADISFLRATRLDDELTATATLRSHQGRTGIYDIQVTTPGDDGSDVVVAEFRGRSRTVSNTAISKK